MLNIREERKAKGLTQEGLAYRAGVSLRTISRLEKTGDGQVRTIRKIQAALDAVEGEE